MLFCKRIIFITNIENANTKLSLPVLLDISNALNCTVDCILCNNLKNNPIVCDSVINDILYDCNNDQREIILDTIIFLKESLKSINI